MHHTRQLHIASNNLSALEEVPCVPHQAQAHSHAAHDAQQVDVGDAGVRHLCREEGMRDTWGCWEGFSGRSGGEWGCVGSLKLNDGVRGRAGGLCRCMRVRLGEGQESRCSDRQGEG